MIGALLRTSASGKLFREHPRGESTSQGGPLNQIGGYRVQLLDEVQANVFECGGSIGDERPPVASARKALEEPIGSPAPAPI
jgi:hypothetical protein